MAWVVEGGLGLLGSSSSWPGNAMGYAMLSGFLPKWLSETIF